jgi:hypothetical protein
MPHMRRQLPPSAQVVARKQATEKDAAVLTFSKKQYLREMVGARRHYTHARSNTAITG